MTPGIEITDTQLNFTEFPSKDTGIAKYCKSFNLNLNDIKLIGISPRLALDDESIFILVIDKSEKIHPIPDHVIGTKGLEIFEKHFELNSIQKEWEKFDYDEHYGKMDKVIYPKEKYWNDLFDNDWKLRIRTLYSWAKPKSFYGNLNEENVQELYPELINYIFDHCWQLYSETEKKAINHHIAIQKFGNGKKLHPKLVEVRDRNLTTDREALVLLKNGYKEFIKNTASRIYKDHKTELNLNLCPNCGKIARTPKAKQCRFCSYDWH